MTDVSLLKIIITRGAMLLLAGIMLCTVPANAREKQRQLSHDSLSSTLHAQAGDNNIRNYQTLRCYQAGQEIINVPGLTNLHWHEGGLSAQKADGTLFSMFHQSANVLCRLDQTPADKVDG